MQQRDPRGGGRAPGSGSEPSSNRETPGEGAGSPGQGLKVGPQASSLSVTCELYAAASGGQRPSAQSPWCPRAAPVGQPSAGTRWRPRTQGHVWCMGSVTSLGSLCVWLPVCLPLECEPHSGVLTGYLMFLASTAVPVAQLVTADAGLFCVHGTWRFKLSLS